MKHKLTAADISMAAQRLREFAAKQTCHWCAKTACDGYENILVRVHLKCSEKRRKQTAKMLLGK